MTHGFTQSAIDPIAVFTDKLTEATPDLLPACQALFAALDPSPSQGFFGAIARLNEYLLTHQGPWLMSLAENEAHTNQVTGLPPDIGPSRFPRIHEPFLSKAAFMTFVTAYDQAYPNANVDQRQEFVDIISGLDQSQSCQDLTSAFPSQGPAPAEVLARPARQRCR